MLLSLFTSATQLHYFPGEVIWKNLIYRAMGEKIKQDLQVSTDFK